MFAIKYLVSRPAKLTLKNSGTPGVPAEVIAESVFRNCQTTRQKFIHRGTVTV